jgi:ATP-dependent DNA helicase RecG
VASARLVSLDDSLETLPAAGPVTAARLADRGLRSVRDLLCFFPRAYEDYRRIYALGELGGLPSGSSVVVRGKVVRVHKFFRRMLDVYIEDGGARLRARWFRPNAGMAKSYARGACVALAGKVHWAEDGEAELVHPSNVTSLLAESASVGIRPRYPMIEKVPGRTVEKIVAAALIATGHLLPDLLPKSVRTELCLPDVAQALGFIHRPAETTSQIEFAELLAGTSPAQRRFALEELFVLQTGLAHERARVKRLRGPTPAVNFAEILADVRAALPFAFTDAQERAVGAIFAAMAASAPMQCLLQGDVGSGKTAVAFAACVRAARAGGQTLFMAPTAVLAEQHLRTLRAWGARANLRTGLLHSGLDTAEQKQVLAAAAAGELDLIVGTHALLEHRLGLSRLALAIVDEQHRFGVRQRARLRRVDAGENGNENDGENGWQIAAQNGMVPHLLVLSATPIPRSLALTLYGDLDLVTLDGLPPGRKPILSRVCVGEAERELAYAAVKQVVANGGQALVVCPAIVEGDGSAGAKVSAVALARTLRAGLHPARVGVLHGQLAAERQRAVLDALRKGSLDVLVSTTVVEVGVDLPRAQVMVIEDAHCFGLAQLHQLRGRVGRGTEQAQCYFLTPSSELDVLDRLRFVAATQDGFRIAEEDLRRRGVGDLQGTRQSGTPELRFADLPTYLGLVETARHAAEAVLAADPDLARPEHADLRRAVAARFETARPVAEEAG